MGGWKGGEVMGWQGGRVAGWQGGRLAGWQGGGIASLLSSSSPPPPPPSPSPSLPIPSLSPPPLLTGLDCAVRLIGISAASATSDLNLGTVVPFFAPIARFTLFFHDSTTPTMRLASVSSGTRLGVVS